MKKIIWISFSLFLGMVGVVLAAEAQDSLLNFVGKQTGSERVGVLIKERDQAKQVKKLSAKDKQALKLAKINAEINDLEAGKIKIAGVIKQLRLTGSKKAKMEQSIKKADAQILKLKKDRAGLIKL